MSSAPVVATAPHEFDAHLIFGNQPGADGPADHGLAPYFAFLSLIRQNGGSKRYSINFRGLEVSGSLYYQESGIEEIRHPDADDLGTVIEPRISWEVIDEDDPVGERSGNFHVRPRAPDMIDEDGDRVSVPDDLVGIDVRAQGSNLDPGRYLSLFRAIAADLGVASRYFEEVHPYSNVQDLARYVRVDRDESGPVHAVDGVLARIGNLLANDREGYRKHVADDTEAPGFYHTATVGSKRAAELVEGHRFAKECKHYLPRHPESFDESHPLFHPKVEVAFQASRNDDGSVPWSDLDGLDREIDETLINLLRWVGLPVDDENQGGPGPSLSDVYVPDQYFRAETDHRPLTLTPDPTPSMKNQQEGVVIHHLRDGLADSDLAVIEQLVADGGQHSPRDLSDETGYHLDTVYRALKRIDELVEHTYGDVALRTPFIAEQLVDAVERAEDAVATAVETGADALAFAAEELESSALVRWLRSYNVDVESDREGRLKLRMGRAPGSSMDAIRGALEKGLDAWIGAGRDRQRFRSATVVVNVAGQSRVIQRALPAEYNSQRSTG